MVSDEIQELRQVHMLLLEHMANWRVFQTKLMGDDTGEMAQGRIPRIEATQVNHEKRIVGLERITWLGRGGALLITGIIALAELAYYLLGVIKH